MTDITSQLYDIYINHQWWSDKSLLIEEYTNYIEKLIDNENYFIEIKNDKVVGYFELWKINYEQLGRLVCGEIVNPLCEDVQSGNIGFLAGVWIGEENRSNGVMKKMKSRFMEATLTCDYFSCERKGRNFPFRVYKKRDLIKGDSNG